MNGETYNSFITQGHNIYNLILEHKHSVLVIHIISIISWMAGLFYLPRLFVYHSTHQNNKEVSAIFEAMEKKLFYIIMQPAMIASWISGIILVLTIDSNYYWIWLKIIIVMFLTHYHFYLNKCRKKFKISDNKRSHLYYRFINEIPTVIMIIVVILVVAKPF